MGRSKNLSLYEKACIQGMFQNDISVLNMSRHLSRSESVVRKYLSEYKQTIGAINKIKKEQEEIASPPPTTKPKKDTSAILYKTAGKGTGGIAVMTQAGSEVGDQQKEHNSTTTQKNRSAIHKIR